VGKVILKTLTIPAHIEATNKLKSRSHSRGERRALGTPQRTTPGSVFLSRLTSRKWECADHAPAFFFALSLFLRLSLPVALDESRSLIFANATTTSVSVLFLLVIGLLFTLIK
jgi:hypothetical protein